MIVSEKYPSNLLCSGELNKKYGWTHQRTDTKTSFKGKITNNFFLLKKDFCI